MLASCCLVRITSNGCNSALEKDADTEPAAGEAIKAVSHPIEVIRESKRRQERQ